MVNLFCKYVYFTSSVSRCWTCVPFPFYFDYIISCIIFVLTHWLLKHDDDVFYVLYFYVLDECYYNRLITCTR